MTEKYSSILFLHDSPRDGLLRKTGQGTVLENGAGTGDGSMSPGMDFKRKR